MTIQELLLLRFVQICAVSSVKSLKLSANQL